MRIPAPFLAGLVPRLGAWGIRLLALTLRTRTEEEMVAPLWASGEPVIYVVWHSQILVLPPLYARRWARHFRVRALTSPSRDGELMARFLVSFGFDIVPGSSSRGGVEALRRLARSLRDGWHVVVVPDGPRGPKEVVKPGVVGLARLTGAPIVPVAVGMSTQWRLRSWDGFGIPKPFARCVVLMGKPVRVPREADPSLDEAARRELEAALAALTRQADEEAAA
jgi:hypothetical protein